MQSSKCPKNLIDFPVQVLERHGSRSLFSRIAVHAEKRDGEHLEAMESFGVSFRD
jgi:hypothetical protein